MSAAIENKLRVELHVHTRYSKDSRVDIKRLLEHCRKIGIDRIAITDHNEIDGALEAYKIAPEMVIIGEEIQTTEGELLGYFMREKIPAGLEPWEVVRRLRAQDAVVSTAHPFDLARSQHWGLEKLIKITPFIDAIEIYNSRCLTEEPNQKAANFAHSHDLLETVGSDAHSLFEVGRATLWMSPFDGPEDFKAALETAKTDARLSPVYVRMFSRYAVFSKRIQKLTNRVFPKRRS